MRQTRLSAAEIVSIGNALYTAATIADRDSKVFADDTEGVPCNPRMSRQFAAQASGYRLLAERIEGACAVILADE